MKCPHCHTAVNLEEYGNVVYRSKDYAQTGMGYELYHDHCPECAELIVVLRYGQYQGGPAGFEGLNNVSLAEILFPKYVTRAVEAEVPSSYKEDY